jgi:hypothetical protein
MTFQDRYENSDFNTVRLTGVRYYFMNTVEKLVRSARSKIFQQALYTALLSISALNLDAADFAFAEERNGEYVYDVIFISGEIKQGDERKFFSLATKATRDTLVSLDSSGGHLKTALEIGRTISLRRMSTRVTNIECISACALIWLAGFERYLNNGERLGFHSAYVRGKRPGEKQIDAVGNALVGAYIRQLELPSQVVELAVESPPDRLTWVTIRNAANFGIVTYRAADVDAHELHNKAFKAQNESGNNQRALQLYREAAKRGFAGSQNNLGDMYEKGEGLPQKSDPFAIYWYTRAAERGEPFAYWSLFDVLSRTAPDRAGLVEALKFGLLAVEYLPNGPDREAARKRLREVKALLTKAEFQLAIESARLWEPLDRTDALLNADDAP